MKKLYALLLFLFTIFQVQAQCNLSLSSTLPTRWVSGNNGAMFDITTGANPITVTGFDMHFAGGETTPYEIYYKLGSHTGFENTSAAWTNAGSALAVSSWAFNLVPVPISLSITIPANTTYSFYITSTSGGVVYIEGDSGSTTISNSDITVGNPTRISYPFGAGGIVVATSNILAKVNYYITGSSQATITTTGILTELYTKAISQNASLPYTATTGTPVSYSINWDAAANTAGLADQASTNFTFTSGAGNLNTITIPANLAAGTYRGNLTIRNAGNCTNVTPQPITLKINEPFTCPADITVPNDAGLCDAVVNYTLPVAITKKLNVLVLGGTYESDVRQKLLSTNQFNTVDAININASTPDLVTLKKYDALLLYTFSNALNSTQLGNTLVQYIDGGGGVVDAAYEATFSHILGAYDTDLYRVIRTNSSSGKSGQVSLGTIELPSHPIMKDVISFDGGTYSFRNDSNVLTPNSYVVARYNNNEMLVMAKENVGPLAARRACLNFFPPSSSVGSGLWNPTTDGAKLMANALKWVGGKATQTAGLASGAVFPVGTTTNTFEYTDTNGDIQTCSFDVTVNDTEAPVADLASLPTITAQCEVTSITAPTAADNCIGAVTGTTTTTFPITASTTVVWTYTDGTNTSTQNQTVTIADTMAPVADVVTLSTITAQCEVAGITAPTATDNCIGAVTGTTTTTFPITASTTVVWTYTDGTNTSTQDQTVTIADTTAPVADLASLTTITAQCEVAGITAPTATDNCIGVVTGTTTTTFPITASTTVVWTYTDGTNTSTQNQIVTIADTMAPVADLASLTTITAQCEVAGITAPTATDNCIGAVTGTTTTTFPITASTTVVWTYTDGTNTSTQNQIVTIADTMAPVADAVTLSTITAQCEVAGITPPTATDNCIGAVTGTTTTIFPITASTTVVWTYSDGTNSSTQNQIVTIADTTAPVADLASLTSITAQCEVAGITPPTATDNCIGAVTGTTTTTFPITASTTVVWTYTDGINTSTQNQTVTIADTTAPVADLASLTTITAQCEVAGITAPTATDNCRGVVTGTTTTTFPITASTTVVWTYTDGTNISTQNQIVTIADTTAPVADLASLTTITAQCEVAGITPPTATDNCIGAVTGTTTTIFPITASTTVVWTYTDGINTSTQNQTVTIADTTAPVADLASLTTITAQCEVAGITAPTATDNCIGAVTGTTKTTFPITASTTVVWTYTDGTNTSTQNQTVTIADTMAPVADVVTLSTITAQCEVAGITAPTATDNCIGAVTGTTTTTFPITASTTVVWTYTDGTNTSTQDQTVTIADTTAPVADAVTLSTITAQCEVADITAPTATDNCIGAVTGTTTTTFPITASTTVVWTYTDGTNTSTQNQTVTIADTTAPVVITKNITIQLNSLGNAVITTMDIDNGSTDNCGIASMALDKNIFNCSNVGVNTVSLIVTDTSGNSASQTASVLVEVVPIVNVSNLSQQFCAVDKPLVSDISIPYNVLNWFADPLSTQVLLPQEALRSGIYYAEVSINTCNTSRIPVTIIVNDEASPSGNAMQYFCRENEAVISDLITNEKEILWYDTASGGVPLDSYVLLEDKHKYYASYFGEKCESSKRFEVEVVFNYCEVIIHNGISANGDGKNDYFNIEGASTFKDNQLEIFNSWGSIVYEIKNYGQADNLFRGYANKGTRLGNGLLPFGTYYYVFSFTNQENKRVIKKGFLHLNP
ncbi:gliding motility-associated C-terminal domain-containing protein [Flavobacterium sp. ACN6]|uniref:T9SS type B sorting domain-containing protein n=1 Tax=Flavobacterium sp. ACN6 TaxID=1920426 RepID=UPI000BB3B812|nr:gliding motility-associated C-terminal domain-containing protein [Flavobacterium sp. ACN6]PBJ15847.1 hypothetical protein BSF42_02510 [Flavobacterium sp. ACN6]